MKSFYLVLPIIFLFFFGCSHTYNITDYSSKEDFYNKFDESAQNWTMTITTTNDSSFYSDGARINNDMLLYSDSQIPVSNIKVASYTNNALGMIPGFLIGTVTGGTAGAIGLFGKPKNGGNHPTWNQAQSTFIGAAIGLFVGTIVGGIIGVHYHFNFIP